MATSEQRQIELLEVYWRRVDRDPAAVPPDGLDPAIAALAQHLQHLGHTTMGGRWRPPPWPPTAAIGRVGQQGSVAVPDRRLPAFRLGHLRWRRIFPGLATAAALTLALVVSAAIWGAHPQPVSAQEILRQAVAATAGPPSQVHSFVLTETRNDQTSQGQLYLEAKRWYQAPNRWRAEYSARLGDRSLGQEIVVSDGRRVWDEQLPANVVRVTPIGQVQSGLDAPPSPGEVGASEGSLADVIRRAGACNAPTLRGSATLLGRDSYVMDTGAAGCPALEQRGNIRRIELWIDKRTFFLLKAVQYGNDGAPLATIEVTSVQFNVPIAPSRFTFTPPSGATIQNEQASVAMTLTSGGTLDTAFMGLNGVPNTGEGAARYGIPDQPGLVVINVLSGSPAARAGIQAKDIVRTVADQPVSSEGDIARILAHHQPGDTVAVTVLRGDTTRTFMVTLGAALPHGQ